MRCMRSSAVAVGTGVCRCANGPDMAQSEANRTRPAALMDAATELQNASLMVRASLAVNPATPPEANAVLAADADERVRVMLARKLGSLVPALSARGQERLRQRSLEILTRLAHDAAVRVRAAI